MEMELIVGISVLAVFLILSITSYVMIKKKVEVSASKENINLDDINASKEVSVNLPYLSQNALNFLELYRKILPSTYVVLPKVRVGHILKPSGSKVLYNVCKEEFLDLVVFLRKNMQPVVVVDIIDMTYGNSSMFEINKEVALALKGANLPVVTEYIKEVYDNGLLLQGFLDALDPIALAQLKKSNGVKK